MKLTVKKKKKQSTSSNNSEGKIPFCPRGVSTQRPSGAQALKAYYKLYRKNSTSPELCLPNINSRLNVEMFSFASFTLLMVLYQITRKQMRKKVF